MWFSHAETRKMGRKTPQRAGWGEGKGLRENPLPVADTDKENPFFCPSQFKQPPQLDEQARRHLILLLLAK